jgi:hypothetical protein
MGRARATGRERVRRQKAKGLGQAVVHALGCAMGDSPRQHPLGPPRRRRRRRQRLRLRRKRVGDIRYRMNDERAALVEGLEVPMDGLDGALGCAAA